jgi:hypothetical protein
MDASPVVWPFDDGPIAVVSDIVREVSLMPYAERLPALQRARWWADEVKLHDDRWKYNLHRHAERWEALSHTINGAIMGHIFLGVK